MQQIENTWSPKRTWLYLKCLLFVIEEHSTLLTYRLRARSKLAIESLNLLALICVLPSSMYIEATGLALAAVCNASMA